ncbi:YbaB/EbfC family nucleoid-associated protein [Dactylosporangium sp. NPDC048998]|uniref:YbaB/EbfC family nucleoid-associated protein n=1 Tax=Dactylosporangium sp. NPDC048998 TaxID=3363976 RepID=UPI00371A19B9
MRPQGQSNPRQLMEQAIALRDNLLTLQHDLNEVELTGSAGNGQVVVTMRGNGEPVRVHIDPAVADPHAVATLEQLVLGAIREAQQAIQTYGRAKTRIV